MDFSDVILRLFSTVVEEENNQYMHIDDIITAYNNMRDAYLPGGNWMEFDEARLADYNDAAHRCAYLHKYAMLHTGMVCEILQQAFGTRSLRECILRNSLNVCSLGGGPGTDVVALLLVLEETFGLVQCSATIVDAFGGWRKVFQSIVSELRTGPYGKSAMVAKGFFRHNYLAADLLADTESAHGPINRADIITMVKFVSAAACDKTRNMIQKIFLFMKPGGMVLFVDNAAGDFLEVLEEEAPKFGLSPAFGPLRRYSYEETQFSRVLYGRTSQSKTKVAAAVWIKELHPGPQMGNIRAEAGQKDFDQAQEDWNFVEVDGKDSAIIHLEESDDEDNEKSEGRCCLTM